MPSNDSDALPQVFVIGSSTTLLFGPHLKQMLEGVYRYSRKGDEPAMLNQAFADLDVPSGASAGNSDRIVRYLKVLECDETFRPDVVLIHVGFHDIMRDKATGVIGVSIEAYRENVATINSWFKSRGIRLVWMTCGPLDEDIHNGGGRSKQRFNADMQACNEVVSQAAAEGNVELLDLAGFTSRLAPPAELFKDHVHVHEAYSKLQAAFIAGYLMRNV